MSPFVETVDRYIFFSLYSNRCSSFQGHPVGGGYYLSLMVSSHATMFICHHWWLAYSRAYCVTFLRSNKMQFLPPPSYVVIEVNVTETVKPSIFVVQRAAAPKNGVEFRQRPIGAIRRSLATSYDVWRRRATSPKNKNALTDWLTDWLTDEVRHRARYLR